MYLLLQAEQSIEALQNTTQEQEVLALNAELKKDQQRQQQEREKLSRAQGRADML